MSPRLSPRTAGMPLLAAIAALGLAAACSSSSSKVGTATTATTAAGAPPAAGGTAANAPVKTMSTSLGLVVVDGATGLTLYHFDKDTPGKIACNAGCTSLWPPETVTATPSGTVGGGTLAAVTRSDGTQQLTWNGMPLYRFAQDKAPGDTAGDGLGGIWHAARAGTAASAGASTPTTAKPSGYGY